MCLTKEVTDNESKAVGPAYTKKNKLLIYISTDLETGGFNTPFRLPDGSIARGCEYRPILQFACMILNKDLEPIYDNLDMMINPGLEGIRHIDDDTWKFHEKNGFAKAWMDSVKETPEESQKIVMRALAKVLHACGVIEDYIIPAYDYDNAFEIIMLGKSVHFDRSFIDCQMPELGMVLSHQLADTSAIKALMRPVKNWPRFVSDVKSTHFALDDVMSANKEAQVIREVMSINLRSDFKYLSDVLDPTLKDTIRQTPKVINV